ncbi:MAG: glycosyltransferase family 4 protein [Phycisphaerales bacterium]|nr:glycosyltransferase family 4 protein [Phycisphaerales bacterium]
MVVPSASKAGRRPFLMQAISPLWQAIGYRVDQWWPCVNRFTEWRFERLMEEGDIVHLWPGVSIHLYRAIKRRGGDGRLVTERINCHRATTRRILDEAYARMGWRPSHGITDAAIQDERDKLALTDWVFSPSPLVTKSMRDNGVPTEKILSSSYGWDPSRFAGDHKALQPIDGVTVAFVGRVCVRKGAHLLLDAWSKAGIRGRLVLAGTIETDITEHCADHLNRSDVVCLGHVSDAPAVFRSADIFVFPSLEEGSPLVMYEACGCGLPSVLSPMAAGEVARDGQESLVRDSYDGEAWVDALRQLAGDAELRRQIGEAARQRAQNYTWERVGNRRGAMLLELIGECERSVAIPLVEIA